MCDFLVDLDLGFIENVLTDYDSQQLQKQNQHDATLASLGNSHNSRWRPKGLPSVKTLQY